MEDNEEMRSHSSKETESPASPRSDGRIAVTVAVSAPPQGTKALAVALPVQQQSKAAGGGREDCWSESATAVLIEAWGERYLELSRGNLKQKHWKDIAEIVNSGEDFTKTPKSDIQCKNRIDTVKKKYKLEKAKIAAGHGPSRWAFFDKLDWLIGPSAKINNNAAGGGGSGYADTPANAGNHKVPMGIPMGARSAPPLRQHQPSPPPPPAQLQQKQKQAFEIKPLAYSDSSDSETEVSADSFPPATKDRKRPRVDRREFMNSRFVKPEIHRASVGGSLGTGIGRGAGGEKDKNWGKSMGELSQAILKFGEAYERTESARIQQMVEIEKQRMKFAKEMELQRMQFFMKTQMDLSQLHNRSRSVKKTNKNSVAATTTATIKNSNISSGNIN